MSYIVTAMNKREWIVLGAALALLAALALQPSIRGNDGVGHYVYLASLLRGGDLDFTDDYARYDALKQYPYKFAELPRAPQTGRPTNRYGIGAACFWAPFVAAVHGALTLARSPQATAMSRPYEWAVGVGTAFWASVGLALLYARLRRRLAPLACAAILAGLIFATPLGFYMYAHGSMSHGVSFFVATALLLAVERAWTALEAPGRGAAAALAWCGSWSAWLMMCRFQDATWVIVTGAALAARAAMAGRRGGAWGKLLIGMSAYVGAFFALFLLQLAVWKYLYGSWVSGPAPYLDKSAGAGYFERGPFHLLETLFSGRRGVLAWHPLIAIGLAGLALLARRGDGATQGEAARGNEGARFLAWVGLVGFAAQLYLVASWSMWWAGASFGNRFFISALPFVALGLGRIAESLDTRRKQASALLILFALIAWNMGLLLQYATEMIPREDWVSWGRIIRQNVVDVPRFLLRRVTGGR